MATTCMHVTQINIYSIKSTAGTSLPESRITLKGLVWDRQWMLVDTNGQAITGREFPMLALIRAHTVGEELVVAAPRMPELRLPCHSDARALRNVQIWNDECTTIDCGEQAARWFSDYLGEACHLVQMADVYPRQIDPDFARPGQFVSFADGFPVLLISEASLEDLNNRLTAPASMRRFRPNLVVSGCKPYAEDDWQWLRIGEVIFKGVKNCDRCVVTTIDPESGVKDPRQEPLRTLGSYRRRPGGGVFFGQNLIPQVEGTIRLNDSVEILS